MFSPAMRIILIAGSLLTTVFMLLRIRAAKVQIKDSIFWIVFAMMLLLLSVFPQIAYWAADVLGILSPINFVYLFIIFILVVALFSSTMRISKLDARIQQLTQRLALNEKEMRDGAKPRENGEPPCKG